VNDSTLLLTFDTFRGRQNSALIAIFNTNKFVMIERSKNTPVGRILP